MKKQTNEFPNLVKISVIVIIIIVCIVSIIKQKEKTKQLELNKRYIIGETLGWTHNHRSSDFAIDFSYTIMGTTYRSFMMVPKIEGIKTKGGRYLVAFEWNNPKNAKMLFDKEVNHTELINYPDTGWVIIPEYVIFK